jgi:enoyl-CoA hydratase/carnithine racemase
VVPDDALDARGMQLAEAMLQARPDALRLTKRTLDAALEATSFDAAMELEERAQMLMLARAGRKTVG